MPRAETRFLGTSAFPFPFQLFCTPAEEPVRWMTTPTEVPMHWMTTPTEEPEFPNDTCSKSAVNAELCEDQNY